MASDPTNPYDPNKTATGQSFGAVGAGALKGAGTGAAVGSMFGLPGAAIGAGVGALAGGIGGGISSRRSSAEKLRQDMLAADTARMQAGQLGMTQSEKDAAIADQTRAAGATIQAQQADIARRALSGGAFSGRFGELQRQLAGETAEATAQASRDVQEKSREQERQEAWRIRRDLDAQITEDAARRAAREETALEGVSGLATATGRIVDSPESLAQLKAMFGIVDDETTRVAAEGLGEAIGLYTDTGGVG